MEEISRFKDLIRIVYHPIYLTNYSTASCESPERVKSIMSHLSNTCTIITPEPCEDADILRCHSEGILITEKTLTDRFAAARMAAGGAIATAELAMSGFVAFGVLRPPGHHASPDHNWGFCFFNNMGIAIKKLLYEKRISSAVILDIDLHFGDGTDNIFKGHNDIHVLNIQSSNPDDFIQDTRDELNKISQADIIGISAGFDQYELDWGGNLSTGDYRTIGEIAGDFAREKAKGAIFGILEGGYYVRDLGPNLEALLTGMCRAKRA